MLNHEPQRFRETEDRVCRFATGIRQIQNRKVRAVNVVVAIDQEQFHAGKLAEVHGEENAEHRTPKAEHR